MSATASAADLPAARPEPPGRLVHRGRWMTLEPLAASHAAALWPLARDHPESWTFLPAGPFGAETSFRALLRLTAASTEEIVWAVRPHDAAGVPGLAAGWLALLDARPAHATVELGNLWFPPGLARSRAATEACFLLLDHVLGGLGYRRVGWKCNALHAASRHAAERLGFRHEGTLRAHMIVRGQRRDTAWFGLLAEDWPGRRPAFEAWLAPSNFDASGRALRSLRGNGAA